MARHGGVSRRCLLAGGAALVLLPSPPILAATLVATPVRGPGRFKAEEWTGEADTDLVQVSGRPRPAYGQVAHVMGRVLSVDGQPLAGVRVEIWQADALGYYHRPGLRHPFADPYFQGYGRMTTGADGSYHFRTLKPVPYRGHAPHIHFRLTRPGGTPQSTAMYLAGQARNAREPFLTRIADPGQRQSLIVKLVEAPTLEAGALAGRFDIVLA